MPLNPTEWATGSTARLMRVPWDSSYKDVIWWTPTQRDNYFDAQTTTEWTVSDMQYLRAGEPVTIPIPYDDCWRANYLVVDNARAPFASSDPVTLCYFITNVTYQAPNSTLLTLQLDTWQTFALTMELGTCYVERGHVAVAASDLSPDTLARTAQRYLLEPEGLDVGNEYVVSRNFYGDLSDVNGMGLGVLVTSTADLEADWGTLSAPNLDTAHSRIVDGLPSGAGLYFFTAEQYTSFMSKVSSAPWISKSITLAVGVPAAFVQGDDVSVGGVACKRVTSDDFVNLHNVLTWDTEAGFENIFADMGGLDRFKKFYTFPYMYMQLDNNTGSPLLLKPELMSMTPMLQLSAVTVVVPPHLRIGIVPFGYGVAGFDEQANRPNQPYTYATFAGERTGYIRNGLGLQAAVWFQTFPQFSLVNDEYLNYLVSTQNTREARYAGAGWTLARSSAASRLSYNQALTNMSNAYAKNQLSNQQFQNSLMGSIGNTALGALSALAGGNIGGALGGVASGIINTGVSVANQDLTNQMFYNDQSTAITLAGQNLGLAQWSAQGDYEQTIKSLNATVQDAALTQPSMSGQVGGDGFNMASGNFGVNLRVMCVGLGRARAIADYWARYGYATNRYVDVGTSLNLMSRYTYWKCADVYVTSFAGDESSKDVVRGIMERGVTVWRDPREVGHVGLSYANATDTSVAALY